MNWDHVRAIAGADLRRLFKSKDYWIPLMMLATLFFVLMTDHHFGGVHMADHAAANGQRPDIVDFAAAVSRNQRVEVVEYDMAMERLGLK